MEPIRTDGPRAWPRPSGVNSTHIHEQLNLCTNKNKNKNKNKGKQN